MATESIISLVTSIIAFIASILTVFLTFLHQNKYDKKQRRVIPSVSLWDKSDNIISRINNDKARIIISSENILANFDKVNLCVCITNLDSYKINSCLLKVIVDGRLETQNSIGTLVYDKPHIIAMTLPIDTFHTFNCEIEYYTEAEEHIRYIIKTDRNFSNRKDTLFLVSKITNRAKQIRLINDHLNLSYNSKEIFDKINELKKED